VIHSPMKPWDSTRIALRKDRATAHIVRRWRALTGAKLSDSVRCTLIACSGGADSVALLLALSAAGHPEALTVAYVRHDMRDASEVRRESESVAELAAKVGSKFVQLDAFARSQPGNGEANYRARRYAALENAAIECGCAWVATGHHADDQLETFLMLALRGAGPGPLGAMRWKRPLGKVMLVRPMLGVTRADAQRICEIANVTYAVDATNTDTTRLRAALRANVVPVLRELRPDVASGMMHTLSGLRGAGRVVRDAAASLSCPSRQVTANSRSTVSVPASPGQSSWGTHFCSPTSASRGSPVAAARMPRASRRRLAQSAIAAAKNVSL
jgi:tRNA(Ile)-lysidine synthase